MRFVGCELGSAFFLPAQRWHIKAAMSSAYGEHGLNAARLFYKFSIHISSGGEQIATVFYSLLDIPTVSQSKNFHDVPDYY